MSKGVANLWLQISGSLGACQRQRDTVDAVLGKIVRMSNIVSRLNRNVWERSGVPILRPAWMATQNSGSLVVWLLRGAERRNGCLRSSQMSSAVHCHPAARAGLFSLQSSRSQPGALPSRARSGCHAKESRNNRLPTTIDVGSARVLWY